MDENNITMRDLWERIEVLVRNVDDLTHSMAELRLDIAVVKNDLSSVVRTKEDHEKRIRSLEQKIWSIPSAATVIALASLLVAMWHKF